MLRRVAPRNDDGRILTPTKKIISLIVAIFFHVAAVYLFYLSQQDRSHFLSALWSGGKSGAEVVIVDITTLADDDVVTESVIAEAVPNKDQQVKLPQPPLAKRGLQNGKDLAKKGVSRRGGVPPPVLANGQGDSDTPAGGVGSGLDKTGVISDAAPSVLAQIRKKIMRKKVYPLHAQENNITGQVSVAFQINADGTLKSVTVQKSSGSGELDAAAVAAIKKAVPLPYYPAVIGLTLEYNLVRE